MKKMLSSIMCFCVSLIAFYPISAVAEEMDNIQSVAENSLYSSMTESNSPDDVDSTISYWTIEAMKKR